MMPFMPRYHSEIVITSEIRQAWISYRANQYCRENTESGILFSIDRDELALDWRVFSYDQGNKTLLGSDVDLDDAMVRAERFFQTVPKV